MRSIDIRRMCRGAAIAASTLGVVGVTLAQPFTPDMSPLEMASYNVPGIGTANTMPEGTLSGHVGQLSASSGNAGGTGKQLYFYGFDYAFTDRLTFGASLNRHADPAVIDGTEGKLRIQNGEGHVKYRFFDNGTFQISGRAAVGAIQFASLYYGSDQGNDDVHPIGAIHVPVTVELTNRLQFHVTPGVAVFPDEINGKPFYGVVPSVGVGATFEVGRRLSFYGSVEVPFGENGNTIASDGTLENTPVWTVGGRYLVTPNAALDVYLTNGFGTSPTSDVATFVPDGDEPVVGVQLTYTPGWGMNDRSSYRPSRPLTRRERHLTFRGLTLSSADTLEPGIALMTLAKGTNDHYSYGGVFSPDQDLEVGYYVERLSDDGSRDRSRTVGKRDEERYLAVGKLRFLDQNNGDAISLSGQIQAGREFVSRFGVFYASVPMSYKFPNGVALTAEPKAAFYGDEDLAGIGLGVNYPLWKGLDLIGEVTPMISGDDMTWSLGARYHFGDGPVSIELQATNAIGNYGVGTMIAQDEVRYSAGVNVALDGRKLLPGLF